MDGVGVGNMAGRVGGWENLVGCTWDVKDEKKNQTENRLYLPFSD